MARGKIEVETSRLDGVSKEVDALADRYAAEFKKLLTTADSVKAVYDGEDSAAFITQIRGFEDDFQKMTQLMHQYAAYLKSTAQTYRDTQDSVMGEAKTLRKDANW